MGLFKRSPKPAPASAPEEGIQADVLKVQLEHQREMAALDAQQKAERGAERKRRKQERRANAQALAQRAIGAYRSHKQAQADALIAPDTFRVEVDTLDGIEKGKLFFARVAMFLGAFLLMIVAAWSVGFFFAGMRDFTASNQDVFLAYIGSFALEAIFTGAMFAAVLNKKRGRPWGLLFAGALVLAFISMLAQFASYETQLQQGRLQVSDSAIESIPLLTWLVGSMKGHSFLFLLRGGAFHFAEILACLGMPSKKRTLHEQIAEMERVQRARIQFQEAQLLADVRAAIAQRVQGELRASVGLPAKVSASDPLSLPAFASNGHSQNGGSQSGNGTFHH